MAQRMCPQEKASLFTNGDIQTGLDGSLWRVSVSATGRTSWVRHKSASAVPAAAPKSLSAPLATNSLFGGFNSSVVTTSSTAFNPIFGVTIGGSETKRVAKTPTTRAAALQDGTVMAGRDGGQWVAKSGRWSKLKSTTTTAAESSFSSPINTSSSASFSSSSFPSFSIGVDVNKQLSRPKQENNIGGGSYKIVRRSQQPSALAFGSYSSMTDTTPQRDRDNDVIMGIA